MERNGERECLDESRRFEGLWRFEEPEIRDFNRFEAFGRESGYLKSLKDFIIEIEGRGLRLRASASESNQRTVCIKLTKDS